MPKFNITTLGCKVNQAESDSMAQDLQSSKWNAALGLQESDIHIVNTCAVTQKAAMQSRQAVRQAIRSNPNAQVIVTGCYAQIAPQEIKAIRGIEHVVGQADMFSVIRNIQLNEKKGFEFQVATCTDASMQRRFDLMPLAIASPRTRPLLKIQDGCNSFCTYCIVPLARGRSRSMPFDKVLESIQTLGQEGYREVVLTGIHLGAYGQDLAPATNLATLMKRIQQLRPIDRIRLSSIEPLELSDDIVRSVADDNIFCRHFHIPLQSGDDGILKKMARPYKAQVFHDLILKIHQLILDAAIGVDILIGFPGESEKAFENTYELIAKLPVSYLHVFPFSARPGTAANKFPNPVPSAVIKTRCQQMRDLGNEKRMTFYQSFIGKKLPVLIESKSIDNSGMLKGISSNYLPVLVNVGDDQKNKNINIRIEKLEGNKLYGNHII